MTAWTPSWLVGGLARCDELQPTLGYSEETVSRKTSRRATLGRIRVLLASLVVVAICLEPRAGRPAAVLPSHLTVGRPIEARLPGSTDYEVCRRTAEPDRLLPRVVCGAGSDVQAKRREILDLKPLLPDFDTETGANVRRAEGRYLLNWAADPRSAARALTSFESALRERPSDPVLRIETAASLAWRAYLEDNPADLFRALDLVSDPATSEPEAMSFLRSVVLTDLGLEAAALASWEAFLAAEPAKSPWRVEAEARRRGLMERRRQSGTTPLFDSWQTMIEVVAADADPASAMERALPELEAQAAELKIQAGDELPSEVTGRFRRLAEVGDRASLRELLLAHARYSTGWAAYQRHELAVAVAALTESRDRFLSMESPWHHWASFYLACAAQQEESFARSAHILERLTNATASRPYPYLSGHVAWMRGVNEYMVGKPIEAAERFLEAEAHFDRAGSSENAALLKVMVGESRLLIGDEVAGWRWLYRGLVESSSVTKPRRRLTFYGPLVAVTEAHGQSASALFFQQLVSDAARELRNPRIEYVTLLSEARQLAARGRATEARSRLDRVLELTESLEGASRERALAAWVVTTAEARLAGC